MSKFNILNKAETVMAYVLTITNKSPKKLRCDIIPNLRNTASLVLEDIIRANICDIKDNHENRKSYQQEAKVMLRVLEAFSEICVKANYITKHQFEVLTKHTCELYDMIVKWEESDSHRV